MGHRVRLRRFHPGAGEHGEHRGRQPPRSATLPGQPQDASDSESSQVSGGLLPAHHISYEEEQTMNSPVRFRINTPTVIHETIDNEVVMIDFDSGKYYSLDKVGADIWRFIEGDEMVGEIVEVLTQRYEGSRAVVENAVNQLIAELQQENLIVPDKAEEPESIRELEVRAEAGSETERPSFEAPILYKYTDMQDLLLLDPIHEVDETGWPSMKPDSSE